MKSVSIVLKIQCAAFWAVTGYFGLAGDHGYCALFLYGAVLATISVMEDLR